MEWKVVDTGDEITIVPETRNLPGKVLFVGTSVDCDEYLYELSNDE